VLVRVGPIAAISGDAARVFETSVDTGDESSDGAGKLVRLINRNKVSAFWDHVQFCPGNTGQHLTAMLLHWVLSILISRDNQRRDCNVFHARRDILIG
jgi:hypothetical protein